MLDRRSGIRFAALLALLVACVAPAVAEDDVFVITPAVKKILDEYLGRPRPAAFAVSRDGTHSHYIYCDSVQCNPGDRLIQRDALQYCGKDCVILAVGKDIKLPYRVGEVAIGATELPACEAGAFGSDFPEGMAEARLSNDDCAGFRAYMGTDHFKAFATTDIAQGFAGWGRAGGYESMQEAIDNALEQCVIVQKRDSIPSECRLYAIGDIIVHDMSDAELRAATELYKTNKNAINADLPAN